MKALAVLLLILTCAAALATDAFVLISPERAMPVVDEYSYVQGEWLMWPPADQSSGSNRLMSLLTGVDWVGIGDPLVFGLDTGANRAAALRVLTRRGYFTARDSVVHVPSFALEHGNGFIPPSALFLAWNGRSPSVSAITMSEPWPPGVVFAEANGWDEVAGIAKKAGGRVLVIEYPTQGDRRWSRYWLRGSGWGNRIPTWPMWNVPGLIPASEAGSLLLRPTRFAWVENDTGNWGGANRWLAFFHYTAPLSLAIAGFLAAFFVGCTVYLISREEHAKLGAAALKYLLLIPASILLGGRATLVLGVPGVVAWLIGAFVLLVFASQLVGGILRKAFPAIHPVFGVCLVGFVATAASHPLWTMYSNVFVGNPLPLAPDAVGAFFGYLVGVCALARRSGQAAWIGRILAVLSLVWGLTTNPWWVSGQWPLALLPLLALLAGENVLRIWMLPLFALVPFADGTLIRGGVVWAPGNLLEMYPQRRALNLARHAEFFTSYGFLGCGLIAGAMAIFVERYFFHEIRRMLLRDSRLKAFFHASFACAAMGIGQPLLLYAALMTFVGGAFVLLSDTAGTI